MKLNLGPAELRYEDEIGIDLFPTPGADIIADIRKLPIANNSCEFVRLDHVLEHFSIREATSIILEIKRVLCTGGIIRIGVPDLEKTFENYLKAKTKFDKLYYLRVIYGSQVSEGQYHKSGYDKDSLYKMLETLDFKNIKVEPDLTRTNGDCIYAEANA